MVEEIQHIITYDFSRIPLGGGRYYKINLPPNIPVREFWSVIVYDSQTRLLIKTGQPWPSVHSQSKKLVINENGSVDVWFGPDVPVGKAINWVHTIPGKGWYMILHLYDPQKPWFDKSWRPGEIEEVK